MPKVTVEDVDDEDDEREEEDPFVTNDLLDPQGEEECELGTGDVIYGFDLAPEPEFIRATGNISQHLAEAAHKNSEKRDFRDAVPNFLHDFQDVFAEESWSSLPNWKTWDHTIKLTEGSEPSNCKVYPLS